MPTETREQRSSPSWIRWLIGAAIVFMLLVVFLPTIVSRTGLLQRLLNGQLSPHHIQASIGQTQLGWLTPTAFRDVRIADTKDRWQFTAAELGSQLSLWQLFASQGDLGTFVIDQPTIVVAIDEPITYPRTPPNTTSDRSCSRESSRW